LELPDQPKNLATAVKVLSKDIVNIAKDIGNSPMSPKSNRTVFPPSSTPKLLASMSYCVKISGSPLNLTGFNGCLRKLESIVLAWPRLHISG
jgi:hypothetical protein